MAKGNFIEYVVSDSPTAYPDGGGQGGYWYERVGEINPTLFGCTKYTVDKFTYSARTKLRGAELNHSLGYPPTFIVITASEQPSVSGDLFQLVGILNRQASETNELRAGYTHYNSNGYNTFTSSTTGVPIDATSEKITLGPNSSILDGEYFAAGVEYILITMA